MKQKHKIAVVDDHVLMSRSLKRLIDSFEDFEVLWCLQNGKELIDLLPKESPDLVLLDLQMPIMDGQETMEYLNVHHPDLKVIALSMNDDEKTILKMIKLGIKGYLLKDTDPAEFKRALNHVINRGFYYTELVNELLLNSVVEESNSNELKDRELEFLNWAATDLTYKEIASKMFASPKTIDNYREALFKKLGVKNRVGLVITSIRRGLIEI